MTGNLFYGAALRHFLSMRKHAQQHNIPVISARNAVFLQQVLCDIKPMRMLEIGSAIGVSTAVIASTLAQWGGQLLSTEISAPTQASAQANLLALGLDNVQSLRCDARDWLAQAVLAGEPPFDAVFIDAHKNQTHTFYAACLPMLASGAVMIVDDAWAFRHKMQAFYELLKHENQSYQLHFVDDADATMVIRFKQQI